MDMGDMGDDFRAYNEQKREIRAKIEPSRMGYAIEQLAAKGIHYTMLSEQELLVDDFIKFWPFTGWYSGKGVGSGRGIHNLIKALTK